MKKSAYYQEKKQIDAEWNKLSKRMDWVVKYRFKIWLVQFTLIALLLWWVLT
ncbi:hypothetical protein JF634_05670 [Simonsiella muelleri]|uniref:hypothetical protein n=1 Tax=Simonsiella muelleri TaxID=72 RepID=UPI0001D09693|nr:hypothetical protein [Simonsiella muelleri]UBQ53978.1 hypothetical protein JF634_00165 [Simonsiella muelleri]UBQ54345.1 hypothetical protein JF634_02210 [Simonsiella muelleri]UBQ54961.1 hypothetical protein JF634_05670 [Simonsiella muelleri]